MPLLLLLSAATWAQSTLTGTLVDEKGKPVRGASISLDNTLDGTTTDSSGKFSLTTNEKGMQTLVASAVGHDNTGIPIDITGSVTGIYLKMKGDPHRLNEVTITAGSFDASNDKDKTVLKPLDIVTTAGAQADVVKAIETLPGTQQTGTENGLFVRGGDASEAQILVDEMVVQNAFFGGPPGVATRSRFGAFQYQGVSFSSGGYSARYGQALSSVLELNTLDLPSTSTVNLGINMAGVYAQGTKLWKNSSLDIGGNYNNLSPFYGIATSNFKFYDVPTGGGANARYVWKPNKSGILKVAMSGTFTTSGIAIPNPYAYDTAANDAAFRNMGDTVNYHTGEQNVYTSISYKQMFKGKYSLYAAGSFSYDNTKASLGIIPINEIDQRAQGRVEVKDFISNRFSLMVGSDVQSFSISKTFYNYKPSFTETQIAGYAEAEWTPISWFAIRPGARYEHSVLLNDNTIAPRISLAIKTGDYSQVSVAGGIFYQDAENSYLLAGFRPKLQEAIHYIANWQWNRDDRTLRLEGYYKNYAALIREHVNGAYNPNPYRFISPDSETVDNSGNGYAQGLELFWRDKKSVKNLDYWISYSYIDTRRLYKNFPVSAQPDFIATHNLNLVSKYFIDKWQTNISATYTFASGRPYYNSDPSVAFLSDRTPAFNNLAVTFAYLHTFGRWFSVFYLSLDNITNQHNIFGYRYGNDAAHTRYPIVPAIYRSVFFGVNFSLTKFNKDEL